MSQEKCVCDEHTNVIVSRGVDESSQDEGTKNEGQWSQHGVGTGPCRRDRSHGCTAAARFSLSPSGKLCKVKPSLNLSSSR
jgi:hypothetical protein